MKCYPIAKINLGLNVVARRPDGYHNLQTIFYPVPLSDELDVEATDDPQECQLKVVGIKIEGDLAENLVIRAYRLLKQDFPQLPCLSVRLVKCIPTQAGMGGGSSDAAYMLRTLNEYCELGLSSEQLRRYAAHLGADCAFFIDPRPQYAEGIGDQLSPVTLNLRGWHLGLVRPDIPVSTAEAYAHVTPKMPQLNCRDVVLQPVETWRQALVNDFEESVFSQHPKLGRIKQHLYDLGATYAAMSGSGSALFGLFRQPVKLDFKDMFTTTIRL